jgi:hypothetical protein
MFERSGIVSKVGGPGHFVKSVDEALRMTELEDLSDSIGIILRVDNDKKYDGLTRRLSVLLQGSGRFRIHLAHLDLIFDGWRSCVLIAQIPQDSLAILLASSL